MWISSQGRRCSCPVHFPCRHRGKQQILLCHGGWENQWGGSHQLPVLCRNREYQLKFCGWTTSLSFWVVMQRNLSTSASYHQAAAWLNGPGAAYSLICPAISLCKATYSTMLLLVNYADEKRFVSSSPEAMLSRLTTRLALAAHILAVNILKTPGHALTACSDNSTSALSRSIRRTL